MSPRTLQGCAEEGLWLMLTALSSCWKASQMKKQIHLEGITKRIKEKETESILSL